MTYTTDLCDAHADTLQICEPMFADFGGTDTFEGPITTLKVFEDNSLVRSALETKGNGGVLVVDGGGSLRCALVGGMLGELAVKNGWAGIVVYGCVRDSRELMEQRVGVKALNTHPLKSNKKGVGEKNIEVCFAGVRFRPGEYLYADGDGVVVSAKRL